MVGEEYGWVPLDGWAIAFVLFVMFLFITIPGFLISLALFPKRDQIGIFERVFYSMVFGLSAPFLLTVLNMVLGVGVNFLTSLLVTLIVSVAALLFFVKRGGNINLVQWYTTKV